MSKFKLPGGVYPSTLPEYKVFRGMMDRCYKPNSPSFCNYGGRSADVGPKITICDEWHDNFAAFYADMGPRGEDENGKPKQIERRNVHGPYAPWNCYWATVEEQSLNRRNTVRLTYNGVELPAPQWAKIIGCKIEVLDMRHKRGWSDREIIETPIGPATYVPETKLPQKVRPWLGNGLHRLFATAQQGPAAIQGDTGSEAA